MSEPTGTPPVAPSAWMQSLHYLRARRMEGFISVIAGFSFVGVATLIIVMGVMNGFRQELLDKILGLNGRLLIEPLDSPLTDWEGVADRLSKVPGVRLAAPVVEGQALASSPFNASGVSVRGIRSGDLARLGSIARNIKQGTLDGFDRGQDIVIGSRLADQLSVRVGDNLTLVAPRDEVTPLTTPRIKAYKITAVFEIGMLEYDDAFVFMPLPEAQIYFDHNEDVTAIEVYTDDPDHIDHRFRKLVAEVAGRPIYILDWRRRNATFFDALRLERNVPTAGDAAQLKPHGLTGIAGDDGAGAGRGQRGTGSSTPRPPSLSPTREREVLMIAGAGGAVRATG
jgi:lipoprotein-releasing system permease protein